MSSLRSPAPSDGEDRLSRPFGFAERSFRSFRAAWAAPRPAHCVVAVLSIWLTVVANVTLWHALAGIDPGPRGAINVLVFGVITATVTSALLSLTAWSRWMKPVWLAVLLAAAVCQHYMLNYGVLIDSTMLTNVAETNAHEAADLLSWTLLGHVVVIAGLPALWLIPLRIERAGLRRTALRGLKLLSASLALALGTTAAGYSALAPLVRNHMELRYLPNPVTPIFSAAKMAFKPLSRRPPAFASISGGAALGSSHAPSVKPPLLVLVVGETARSDHFALNGYARATTPELAALGVLSYRNVWSCGTDTHASVPCMFSSLGRERFAKRTGEQENLLDVLQAAGLAVLWIDNQAGCKGVCDRVVSASTSDLVGTPAGSRLCHDGECLDEALLQGLDARIAALPEERRRNGIVVVMHQMGSHGPAYGKRSPAASKRFLPECSHSTLNACERSTLINTYDNSIAYTDHVLASTVTWLQTRQDSFATAMLYVSDHGESLGEYGIYLHGVPYPLAPDSQKHVPLIAWLGEGFAQQLHLDRACLLGRLEDRLTHDNLYHTVLGIVDVATPTYRADLDIWERCRGRESAGLSMPLTPAALALSTGLSKPDPGISLP